MYLSFHNIATKLTSTIMKKMFMKTTARWISINQRKSHLQRWLETLRKKRWEDSIANLSSLIAFKHQEILQQAILIWWVMKKKIFQFKNIILSASLLDKRKENTWKMVTTHQALQAKRREAWRQKRKSLKKCK